MQIKNNLSKYLQKPWFISLLKTILLVGCMYFIYSKWQSQTFPPGDFKWPSNFGLITSIVFVLMIFNWYLESLRWKVSIEVFESITLIDAWKVVLGGLTLNWVLPFTSGDFIARISQQRDKLKATSAAMLNRGIMLVVTSVFGLFGIGQLAIRYKWNHWALVAALIITIMLIVLFRKHIGRFASYFKELSKGTLIRIVILSLLRYFIFVTQFFLLLNLFLPGLDDHLIIAGIGWIFLARTALPLIMGGAGVREASGLIFFEPYVANIEYVLVPIVLVWIINIVIPSLAGLILLLKASPSGLKSNQSS